MRKNILMAAMAVPMLTLPVQAHAACCAGAVAAIEGASAAIVAAVAAFQAAQIANDNLLFRDMTGKSITTVLREMQATSMLDQGTNRKTIENALQAHRDSLISYGRQEQQLEMARKAKETFPDVSAAACQAFAMAKTAKGSDARLSILKAAGSTLGADRSEKYTDPLQVSEEYKKSKTNDFAYASVGHITHPGCTPKPGSATVFENGVPVPVEWDCSNPDAQAAPNTIPDRHSASAIAAINTLIEPKPIPVLPVSQRKTMAGEVYEYQRDVYRNQMALYRDLAMDSLARFQATRELDSQSEQFFTAHGLTLPANKKISEMDYLNKHVQARWDNPKYMEEIHQANEKTLLLAIQDVQNLQNAVIFRLLKLMEGQNLAYITTSAAEYDGLMRPELQQLRVKAASP